MKTTRQNPKVPTFPTHAKERWSQNDNTRPVTFPDRRKVADKKACRGKVYAD